jgi:hypothetical protein
MEKSRKPLNSPGYAQDSSTEFDHISTFYRWKKKYGDMELADAKRLKALEKENAELKKRWAESML